MTSTAGAQSRFERALKWGLFVAWVVLTTVVVAHHETWRDEADSWLLARDASPAMVLSQASSGGTPVLWYLLLMPLAKAGLWIAFQQWLNWLFCAVAVWLIAVGFDLPLPARVAGVASFHFAYEYVAVSRSYAMGIALVFCAVALWRKRADAFVAIGILLALAANTSVHGLILAGCVAAALAVDGSTPARHRALALALFGAGVLAAALQLYPPGDFVTLAPRGSLYVAMAGAVHPLGANRVAGFAGCLAAGAVAIGVRRSRSALALLGCALVGFGALFQLVYLGFPRHHGFLLVSMLVALAICGAERSTKELRLAAALLALAFVPSILDAWHYSILEIARPYSGSVGAARVIEQRVPPEMPIAAHKPVAGESVLVHLDRPTFYYPALDRDGSYMGWDDRHWVGDQVTTHQAIEKAERHFGTRRYALLLDRPLPGEDAAKFDVVGLEGRNVFSDTMEFYAICIRK